MADNGENGGTGSGEGGNGQPDPQNTGGAGDGDQSGSGTGGNGNRSGSGNGQGGSGDGDTVESLRTKLAELEADRDSWKKRSRQHEDKAKQNADAAKQTGTLEEQLDALRKDIAQRDADAVTERADQAAEKLQAKLVRGGLSDEDATTLVGSIDPMRLLADGKPDTGEIDKLAKSLIKIGTRPSADGDQGRKGGDAPPSMNQLIRDAAKRSTVTS